MPRLHRFATLTAAMTLILLIAGGLVTSTGSGLSVPDWPLSYGTLFPPMVGGIRYEHTHRVIAAIVGLMIAVLAAWLRLKEPRRWVRRLGYAALLAVLLQALLGGLTVRLMLPAPVSVAHACVGQLVFCLVVSLALVTSPLWQAAEPGASGPFMRRWCVMMTGLLSIQLILGATIRHAAHARAALILHVLWATVIAAWVWRLRRSVARQRPPYQPLVLRVILVLLLAVGGQMLLGASALLRGRPVVVTTAHVVLGALLLAGSWALTMLVCRFPIPVVDGPRAETLA